MNTGKAMAMAKRVSKSKSMAFFVDDDYHINNDFNGILFIASGGSEQVAVKLTGNKNNIILLCHRESNSYAATIEIAAYLRSKKNPIICMTGFFLAKPRLS